MAPRRLYRLPNEQLVDLLREAREEGLSFQVAWLRAVRPGKPVVMTNTQDPPAGAVRWPTDSSDRIAWQAAIAGAKDGFRRAYECRPTTRRERAVSELVDVLIGAADRRDRARGIRPTGAVRSAA